MADEAALSQALINAHNAGDTQAAQVLAAEIMRVRGEADGPDAAFAKQAAGMDPMDLSVARSKNDEFGDYLRRQASAPKPGETPAQTFKRQYGGLPDTNAKAATWGAAKNFSNGVLQGMGDEVAAAGEAARGGSYDQAQSIYQRARSNYMDQNPVMGHATDIAGQVAPWLVAAPLMPEISGATLGPRVAKAAGIGAGIGATSGFLNAEGDLGDRAKGSAMAAALGGAAGGISVPVIDMVSALGSGAYNQVAGRLPFGQESVAQRKIAEALAREGMTPDQALARMQEIGPEASLMDVGANPRALGAAVYQRPGEGKQIVGDFLTARQEGTRAANGVLQGGQINRVTDQIDNLVPNDFYAARQGIADARSALGKNYEAAKAVDTPVDTKSLLAAIDDQLKTAKGGIRTALQKARETLFTSDGALDTSVDGLHEAKMAIDDLINGTAQSSIGRTAQGRLKGIQSKLVDAIETVAPDYRTGRLGTAAEWQKSDALESGARLFSKTEFANPQEMQQAVAKMSPEELHNFRVGAVQALKQKIGDLTTRADATKKLMDVPALEQKIRLAFGDDNLFRQYIQGLQGERTMFDAYAAAKGNSLTAERTAALADSNVDPSRIMQGLQRMVSGNPLDWIGGGIHALGGVKDRIMLPEGTAKEMARILVGQDVAPIRNAAQAQQLGNEARRRMAMALTDLAATRSGATQSQ